MTHPEQIGRVMLVDDEQLDQRFYRRILERSGLVTEVISYTDPRDAVAHLANPDNPPVDLVLLDIRMPVMDGFEFLDAAGDFLGPKARIPVVFMLTTSLSPKDKARADASPCVNGYLSKPLTDAAAQHLQALVAKVRVGLGPDQLPKAV